MTLHEDDELSIDFTVVSKCCIEIDAGTLAKTLGITLRKLDEIMNGNDDDQTEWKREAWERLHEIAVSADYYVSDEYTLDSVELA